MAATTPQNELLSRRVAKIGPSLSISYNHAPLHIVRGQGQYLFDDAGVKYLDCVNNVCHVGHCHPTVVKAAQEQLATLNTNTRYLHNNIVDYADQLTATLPASLSVCYFVNSGSEANDLALRIAKVNTGLRGIIVLDHAYHGHTSALIDISPYKFNHKGGFGKPEHVQILPCPDGYRGLYRYNDPNRAQKYADHSVEAVAQLQQSGHGVAAFIAESALGCAGQVFLPPGYLSLVYNHVRQAGGVCIADEVQVGFGRVGDEDKLWAFQLQNVVPDIVTLGKPIGNGFPMAAVITTVKLANGFANGLEYFNTFGGNPVSMAVGQAVLRVIREDKLITNAANIGTYWLQELNALRQVYDLIGDVRGRGLFIGIELVLDHKDLTPATQQATWISRFMKDQGVLVSTDGPFENVLKIKPPMCISRDDVDLFIIALRKALDAVPDISSNLPTYRAIVLAQTYYGLQIKQAYRLPSYSDQNFLLQTSDEKRFVLKIAHPSVSPDKLSFENALMHHINHGQHDHNVTTPDIVEPLINQVAMRLVLHESTGEHIRLVTYIEGNVYASIKHPSDDLLTSFGKTMALIDLTLSKFTHPGSTRDCYWNLEIGRQHVQAALEQKAQLFDKSLIDYFMPIYDSSICCDPKRGACLRRQVIHGDCNDYNVLVNEQENAVVGFIDYGDACETRLINELAIALAYAILPQNPAEIQQIPANATHAELASIRSLHVARLIVKAYHAVLPLTQEEFEALYPLICLRLCVSVVTSQREKQLRPGNDYISITERAAWAMLTQLKNLTLETFSSFVQS